MPHPVEKRIALDGVAYTFEKHYDKYGAKVTLVWNERPSTLQTYEKMWQELRNAEQFFPVLNGLEVPELAMEVPNCTSSACPHVASVLDSLHTETLDWLTKTYLWGEVAEYGRSSLRV